MILKIKKILKKIYLIIKKVVLKFIQLMTYIYMFIVKPSCMIDLLKNIKHGNILYGCYTMDKLYFKNGKIVLDNTAEPVVSIIIPVFNQIEYTYKCLMSIEKYTKNVSYEVIIGDDLSFDGTKYLDRYVENIHISRNEVNTGFLLNCNNAASKAKGKYILFLNNDTEVTENWLSSLVELIESDKTIGMVGSKLIYPNGVLQEAGGVIFSNGSGINYGGGDDPAKAQYNYIRDVDYISGASIMISQKLWKKIGGFDKRYIPAYCEDSDLAFEVRKAGYRVVYQPKSVVIHYEGISNGRDVNNTSGLKHYQIENNLKLKEKWEKELKLQPKQSIKRDDFTLRDRIKEKGMILVVDHYVPEYDKDAGSRTTFQYLKMFVKEGYTVKFLPDNFYQNEPYTSELEKMGIEVLYGPEYANGIFEWLDKNKNNIDTVYLNRPNIAPKYIDYFKEKTDIKIIYYGHDLHFLREMREYELTGNKEKLISSNNSKKIEFDIMEKADYIYYPSYVEEEAIKKIDPNINVKAINAYLFDDVNLKEDYNFKNKNGIMFVGGFNHTPNVDGINWFMKEVYPLIQKKKNIPFTIAGSNPPQVIKDYANDKITVTGFISDEELAEIYNKSRIVVAPLRYGAGIKGKVVEAMSKGMPIVTTSIGAEGLANTENILMIEDDPKKFADAILKIYDDENELKRISKEEKEYIVNNYSSKAAWNIIKKDFEKTYDFTIVTPDGYGSYGDEALLRGALDLIDSKSVKIVTERKELFTDKLKELPEGIVEEYVPICDLEKVVIKTKNLIILGADILDGTYAIENSITRLKVANRIATKGGNSYVFFSFKSNAAKEVLDYIDTMSDKVNFYLRDELSMKNFQLLTGKEVKYFPDMAFFVNKIRISENKEITRKLLKIKYEGYNLVGLNFSETAFRSMHNEFTFKNKKKYVKDIIEAILKSSKEKLYFGLLCHDIRHWDDYSSDADYQIIAEEVLKEMNYKNYILIDSSNTHIDLLNILPAFDTVITGRMHLAIACFRSNVIPLIYTGNKNNTSVNQIDKMRGMFINRLNDSSFVVNNEKELSVKINELLDFNNQKINEIKRNLKMNFEKDLVYKNKLKKEMEFNINKNKKKMKDGE